MQIKINICPLIDLWSISRQILIFIWFKLTKKTTVNAISKYFTMIIPPFAILLFSAVRKVQDKTGKSSLFQLKTLFTLP